MFLWPSSSETPQEVRPPHIILLLQGGTGQAGTVVRYDNFTYLSQTPVSSFDNPESQTLYGNTMWLDVVCKNCVTIFKRETAVTVNSCLQITHLHAPKEAKVQAPVRGKETNKPPPPPLP